MDGTMLKSPGFCCPRSNRSRRKVRPFRHRQKSWPKLPASPIPPMGGAASEAGGRCGDNDAHRVQQPTRQPATSHEREGTPIWAQSSESVSPRASWRVTLSVLKFERRSASLSTSEGW